MTFFLLRSTLFLARVELFLLVVCWGTASPHRREGRRKIRWKKHGRACCIQAYQSN